MNTDILSALLPRLPFFLAAASTLSFTKAATELCVTQGAVSHRIRQLEEELGFPLFRRLPRRLALTDEGQRLYSLLHGPMRNLENEIRQLRHKGLVGTLRVHCPPSLTGSWLLPRLKDFQQQHSGINVHVHCRNELADFESTAVDVAIFYGARQASALHMRPLMGESLMPVCSPAYAAAHDLARTGSAGLAHCLLLHDNSPWPHSQYASEWQNWAEHTAVALPNLQAGYSFDRTELAAQAAEHGLGVALGRRRLVAAALKAGRLVAPVGGEIPAPQEYSIVTRHEDTQRTRVRAFADWLLEAAAEA